jgi:hypothetical protein
MTYSFHHRSMIRPVWCTARQQLNQPSHLNPFPAQMKGKAAGELCIAYSATSCRRTASAGPMLPRRRLFDPVYVSSSLSSVWRMVVCAAPACCDQAPYSAPPPTRPSTNLQVPFLRQSEVFHHLQRGPPLGRRVSRQQFRRNALHRTRPAPVRWA